MQQTLIRLFRPFGALKEWVRSLLGGDSFQNEDEDGDDVHAVAAYLHDAVTGSVETIRLRNAMITSLRKEKSKLEQKDVGSQKLLKSLRKQVKKLKQEKSVSEASARKNANKLKATEQRLEEAAGTTADLRKQLKETTAAKNRTITERDTALSDLRHLRDLRRKETLSLLRSRGLSIEDFQNLRST